MKRLLQLGCLVALLIPLCGTPAFAQAPDVRCTPERGGAGCRFAPRVMQALEKLDLGCRRWTILLLDEEEWKAILAASARSGRTLHTERAFTLHAARRTYLRESYFAGRPEPVLVEILAHEFAHLRICGTSESCAKEIAARIAALVAKEAKNEDKD